MPLFQRARNLGTFWCPERIWAQVVGQVRAHREWSNLIGVALPAIFTPPTEIMESREAIMSHCFTIFNRYEDLSQSLMGDEGGCKS